MVIERIYITATKMVISKTLGPADVWPNINREIFTTGKIMSVYLFTLLLKNKIIHF